MYCDECDLERATVREAYIDDFESLCLCKQCRKDSNVDHYCRYCKAYSFMVRNKCGHCSLDVNMNDEYDHSRKFYTKTSVSDIPNGKDVYFGVELEVEYLDNKGLSVREFKKIFGNKADATEDGSLKDGSEIRSDPMTLDVLTKNREWAKFFRFAKNRFHERPTTAGMHIHVSENSLDKADILRISRFFRDEYDFVTSIAERKKNNYLRYIDCDNKYYNPYEHYSAVNITDYGTYEFRIFQSIIDKSLFYKNIEFVQLLIDYCNETNGDIALNELMIFLARHYRKYPNLIKFMKKNKIAKSELKISSRSKNKLAVAV